MSVNEQGKESEQSTKNLLNGKEIVINRIDHLGIVAAGIQQLGIVEFFDRKLPKEGHHRVSHGQAVAAMILIGLGYVNRRLYLTPQFLKGFCVERLIGKGLKAEDFNDDVVGRLLDAIYEAGPTELFLQLMLSILPMVMPEKVMCFHVDTTSISVQGEYETTSSDEEDVIDVTYGYSKANRPDLKQILLCLVTNQDGIPFYFKTLSGNASDKETIQDAMKKTITAIKENLSEDRKTLYIADSAFYTEKNVQLMGPNNLFISHAPSTLGFVQEMEDANVLFAPTSDVRYAIYLTKINYGGVPQAVAVVSSQEKKQRELKTFERKKEKEREKAEKSLRKLQMQKYYCAADAREGLKKWNQQNRLFIATLREIVEKTKRTDGLRGKTNDPTLTQTLYHVHATLTFNDEEVQRRKARMGRFVLVTNDLSLDGEAILALYKQQNEVEKGFRFLKDPTFCIDDIFLKSRKRIMALNMLMVLTLMVYSLLDRDLIRNLKEKKEILRGVENRVMKRPTLRAIFFLFQSVFLITTVSEEGYERYSTSGMDPGLWKILNILGEPFVKMYS